MFVMRANVLVKVESMRMWEWLITRAAAKVVMSRSVMMELPGYETSSSHRAAPASAICRIIIL